MASLLVDVRRQTCNIHTRLSLSISERLSTASGSHSRWSTSLFLPVPSLNAYLCGRSTVRPGITYTHMSSVPPSSDQSWSSQMPRKTQNSCSPPKSCHSDLSSSLGRLSFLPSHAVARRNSHMRYLRPVSFLSSLVHYVSHRQSPDEHIYTGSRVCTHNDKLCNLPRQKCHIDPLDEMMAVRDKWPTGHMSQLGRAASHIQITPCWVRPVTSDWTNSTGNLATRCGAQDHPEGNNPPPRHSLLLVTSATSSRFPTA